MTLTKETYLFYSKVLGIEIVFGRFSYSQLITRLSYSTKLEVKHRNYCFYRQSKVRIHTKRLLPRVIVVICRDFFNYLAYLTAIVIYGTRFFAKRREINKNDDWKRNNKSVNNYYNGLRIIWILSKKVISQITTYNIYVYTFCFIESHRIYVFTIYTLLTGK